MEVILLVWLPWSWKSTFRDQFVKINPNSLILSSDNIRDEIIDNNKGNVIKNEQVNPFPELYNRLETALIKKTYDHIIIDATNTKKKDRRKIIEFINQKNQDVSIKAYMFHSNIIELYDRVYKRTEQYKKDWFSSSKHIHKFVTRDVINWMVFTFDMPSIDEGFKEIVIFNYDNWLLSTFTWFTDNEGIDVIWNIGKIKDNTSISNILKRINEWEEDEDLIYNPNIIDEIKKEPTKTMKGIYNFLNIIVDLSDDLMADPTKFNEEKIKSYFNKLLNTNNYFIRFLWLEQTSKYHQETLDKHIYLMFKNFLSNFINKKYDDYLIKNYINTLNFFTEMILLIFTHDIWKLFTREKKINNLIKRGYKLIKWKVYTKWWKLKEVKWLDDYQFLWHEKVSASLFLLEFIPVLTINYNDDFDNVENTISVLNSLYWNIFNHLVYHEIVRNIKLNDNYSEEKEKELFMEAIVNTKLPYTKWFIDYNEWYFLEKLDSGSRVWR